MTKILFLKSGSIQQCAFACDASHKCKGFSYNVLDQICTPKTSFSLSKIHPAKNFISGAKHLCQPWMTVFRHDSIDEYNPSCSVMFGQDHESTPSIYTNLDELEFLRNSEDNSIHLKLTYPRTVNYDQFIWKQTSNPVNQENVEGFELKQDSSE